MRREVEIIGSQIYSLESFHEEIAQLLHFPHYYAKNLDDLLDCLTSYIDPNLTIHWLNSDVSSHALGNDFQRIIEVFNRAKAHHDSFEYKLS